MEKQNLWPGWETVKLIGRGSFGAVYEIQRDIFGETEKAALKVISIPQNSGDLEEMYNDGYDDESITSTFTSHLKSIVAEYSLMRKMNGSSNIVNCDDVRYVQHNDSIGWDIFIKMELLTPLAKTMPEHVPESMVIRVGRDLCVALELCAKYNIVHRDIKPQNIFCSDNGDYKLGDFGIAKTVEKTMGGTKIGTYKYMAPEVYNNQPYGAAADIYSLGLVLYWMLNERRMPFMPLPPEKIRPGMEEHARLRRFSGEQIPPPMHGSEALKAIVLKACAYHPQDRFADAGEMLKALKKLDNPYSVTPPVEQTVPVPEEEDEETTVVELEDTTVLDTNVKAREDEQRRREQARLAREEAAERKAREKAEAERQARAAAMEASRRKAEEASHEHQQELRESQRQEDTQRRTRNGKLRGLMVFVLLVLAIGGLAINFLWPHNSEFPKKPEENVYQDSPEQPDPVGPVDITLKVWAPSGDQTGENPWLLQMEQMFAQAHPEYHITWENGVCSEELSATLIEDDPANAPDIYMFANDGLNWLVDAGALTRLEGSYLEQVQNEFSATYVNSVTFSDGGVYGFPMTPNTWFMYYNKAILSQEDVKSLEACLKKGQVAFPVDNAWFLPAFFFANGCTLFGEGGNDPAAGVQLGGEAGYQAALRVVELVNNEPNFKNDTDYYGYNGLCNGTVAAYFSGSWEYKALYEVLGENLGACALPTVRINGVDRQMKAYAGTKVVGVNPNCENRKAAMEFASFLASYESQLLRFHLRGITPALTALADHEAVSASIVTIAEMDIMRYAAFPQPIIREMNQVWGPVGDFGSYIMDGTIERDNVKEFLDRMVAAAG